MAHFLPVSVFLAPPCFPHPSFLCHPLCIIYCQQKGTEIRKGVVSEGIGSLLPHTQPKLLHTSPCSSSICHATLVPITDLHPTINRASGSSGCRQQTQPCVCTTPAPWYWWWGHIDGPAGSAPWGSSGAHCVVWEWDLIRTSSGPPQKGSLSFPLSFLELQRYEVGKDYFSSRPRPCSSSGQKTQVGGSPLIVWEASPPPPFASSWCSGPCCAMESFTFTSSPLPGPASPVLSQHVVLFCLLSPDSFTHTHLPLPNSPPPYQHSWSLPGFLPPPPSTSSLCPIRI